MWHRFTLISTADKKTGGWVSLWEVVRSWCSGRDECNSKSS